MDLKTIESLTVGHYDTNAADFFAGTIDHDVSQNYQAFLSAMESDRSLKILDFGCGPGRDLKYFSTLGHVAVGLDGSAEFCKMAREYSGCDVLNQNFLNVELPEDSFDGIFANASLFHIPAKQLTNVLRTLHKALCNDGILFMSNPRGESEGWSGQRYGNYMEYDVVTQHLKASGYEPLHHYYRPIGKPLNQQPWLAVVSRRC